MTQLVDISTDGYIFRPCYFSHKYVVVDLVTEWRSSGGLQATKHHVAHINFQYRRGSTRLDWSDNQSILGHSAIVKQKVF